MIVQFKRHIERRGDEYVVTISKEEAERYHIRDGQEALLGVTNTDDSVTMSPELREVFERVWARNEAVIRAIGPE